MPPIHRSSVPRSCAWHAILLGVLAVVAAGPAVAGVLAGPGAADAEHGRLVVFVQPEASPLARQFGADTLSRITELCAELGIELSVRDVADGAPAEVTLTPLLVYQNHRGRSIFRGRYAAIDRLRTFLRTSRRRPQGSEALQLSDVVVWQHERARIVAPLKLAPPSGSPPDDLDLEAFAGEARAAVASGLTHFVPRERAAVGRSDRAFYMDFYPYLADDGTLYLSTALFSEFHCKTPVWTTAPDAPYTGPWDARRRLYAQAAADLERVVGEQLASTELGDGFDPVPAELAGVEWSTLGLSLPAPPAGIVSASSDLSIPDRWRVLAAEANVVQLAFAFPAPLDYYGGEVTAVAGTLELGARDADGSYPDARGRIDVPARSVTMGDADIDRWIHGAEVLLADDHPTASFTLGALQLRGRPLDWGAASQVVAKGEFSMAGKSTSIEVRAQLEPVFAADGEPRLLASGTFPIPLLAHWGIEAPVGDDPASETLVFDFDFVLEPVR